MLGSSIRSGTLWWELSWDLANMPKSNAGGGGERVLWAAIRATQDRWPKAKCIVYTGDHDVTKDAILSRVKVYWAVGSDLRP